MKKWLSVLMSVLLIMLAGASAVSAEQTVRRFEVGQIVVLDKTDSADLNDDGTEESILYEVLTDDNGYDVGYKLTVGQTEVTGEGWDMDEEIRALRLDEHTGVLLLVTDYGPSDDYETHFYLYESDSLLYAGSIHSLPESMKIEGGVITASIRGNLLYTWFREADYTLAYGWNESWELTDVGFCEIPRYLYPMGLIVRTKIDLPLLDRMGGDDIGAVIQSSGKAVLTATDDKEWVYIQTPDGTACGWLRVNKEDGMGCFVADEEIESYNLFDGLLFAD